MRKYKRVDITSMCGKCLPYFASSSATPTRDLGVRLNTLCGGSEITDALSGIRMSVLQEKF